MQVPHEHLCDKNAEGELLIIGPEGGFTSDEIEQAQAAGLITAGLGPQILRVETAAVAAMAIWQSMMGNMDP